jgi:hypothetical protein
MHVFFRGIVVSYLGIIPYESMPIIIIDYHSACQHRAKSG